MSYANIYAPTAESVGGIAGKIATSTIVSACAFDGNIEAGIEAGGIVSVSSADDVIKNCHVTADIYAKGTVGGVVGTSDRSRVANCYVEGSIELDENAKIAKVGGVIGAMGSTLSDTVYALVDNNIVALEEMVLPKDAELYAHRIVGYSNGDSFEYDWDNLDSGGKIYNAPEKCLKNNYVVSDLAAIDATIELNDTTTEGATMDRALLTTEWLVEHGFVFGEDIASPWMLEEIGDLRLWFEDFDEIVAVEDVQENTRIVVWFEGDELVAEGEIYLFNLNGQLMSHTVNRMNVVGLPTGVYVAKTTEGVAKVIIR